MNEALASWVPQQRWYATKHVRPRCEIAELRHVAGPYHLAFVRDSAPDEPVMYHVPIGVGDAPDGVSVIAAVDGRLMWDACTDPAFIALRLGLHAPVPVHVMSGEQSNTSVICQSPGLITKFFRVLSDGANPDVELTEILTRAGCRNVPRFVSAIYEAFPGGEGHLQVTHEFISDAEDAWRTALVAAREGTDLDAHGLGVTIARIHALLAQECGTSAAEPEPIVGAWRRRAAEALSMIESLRTYSERIDDIFEAALASPWPPLQRIHGDLHLGQVIESDAGWIVLDFEGEPIRPLGERRRPDLSLRDVAGMLRSFDYAQLASGSTDLSWSARARAEFLAGYSAGAQHDPTDHATLLAALELDKALCEAVYEARNRPGWLHVPLAGIDRIVSAA